MARRKRSGGILYNGIRKLGKPVMRALFRSDIETLQDVPQPFILLSNHTTDFDPAFLTMAANEPVSFVATENLLRMGLLGRLAVKIFHPIIHNKGSMGLTTAKSILQAVRDGKNVAMFPEGNRSFNGVTCPIPPVTGKLVRTSRAALVTYRLTGGYLSSPRWAATLRKGRVAGRIVRVYSPETLKEMSAEEIQEAIENDLRTDAYAEQRENPVAFRGKKRAQYLESALFLCPVCKKTGSLKSHGNLLTCGCGFRAEYDEYGLLRSAERSYTVTELDAWQREETEKLCREPGENVLFEDEVRIQLIGEDHESGKSVPAVLRAYRDRLTVGETVIPFAGITGIAITLRNLLLIHASGLPGHCEISGEDTFNALKYLYLYRAVCGSNGLL